MLQNYIKKNKTSIFENNQLPQLLYITNTAEMKDYLPRMLHKHEENLEVVFIAQGCGNHLIDGVNYETKAGDILIFNPNVIHDETAQSNSDMVTYTLGINRFKIKGMEENSLFETEFLSVISSGEYQSIIEKTLDIMLFHVKENTSNATEICRYLLSSLITLIVELPDKKQIYPYVIKRLNVIDNVKAYIETYYEQELSLSDLAKRFQINAYYLAHLFKKQTGFSPMQYIHRRRIGEAQTLLMTTNHSIAQIATLCGFMNSNYFSTAFQKTIGVTPSQYRSLWIGRTTI